MNEIQQSIDQNGLFGCVGDGEFGFFELTVIDGN